MTFIEVVAAMALIGVIASMIAGTIAFSRNASGIMHRRAEAAEAAHRIIIQHLEDPGVLDKGPRRVDLNGTLYHYELREFALIGEDAGAGTTRRKRIDIAQATMNERLSSKVHMVSVDIFDAGALDAAPARPLATLTRVYNPLNTDDPDKILDWLGRVIDQDTERLRRESGVR